MINFYVFELVIFSDVMEPSKKGFYLPQPSYFSFIYFMSTLRLSWSNYFYCLYMFYIILCCARDQGSAGRKRLSLGSRSETQWFIYRNEE